MSLSQLVGTELLGMPLVAWGGLLTLLLLATTASYGYLLFKGKIRAPVTNHFYLAAITIVVALIHATAAAIWIFGL